MLSNSTNVTWTCEYEQPQLTIWCVLPHAGLVAPLPDSIHVPPTTYPHLVVPDGRPPTSPDRLRARRHGVCPALSGHRGEGERDGSAQVAPILPGAGRRALLLCPQSNVPQDLSLPTSAAARRNNRGVCTVLYNIVAGSCDSHVINCCSWVM